MKSGEFTRPYSLRCVVVQCRLGRCPPRSSAVPLQCLPSHRERGSVFQSGGPLRRSGTACWFSSVLSAALLPLRVLSLCLSFRPAFFSHCFPSPLPLWVVVPLLANTDQSQLSTESALALRVMLSICTSHASSHWRCTTVLCRRRHSYCQVREEETSGVGWSEKLVGFSWDPQASELSSCTYGRCAWIGRKHFDSR